MSEENITKPTIETILERLEDFRSESLHELSMLNAKIDIIHREALQARAQQELPSRDVDRLKKVS